MKPQNRDWGPWLWPPAKERVGVQEGVAEQCYM